jgi:hypothetical protein
MKTTAERIAIANRKTEGVDFPVRTDSWGHTPYGKYNTKAKALLNKQKKADLSVRYKKRPTRDNAAIIQFMKKNLSNSKSLWAEILAEVDGNYTAVEKEKFPRIIDSSGKYVYDPEFILTRVLRAIKTNPKDFWNMDDIVAVSGLTNTTFYQVFPVGGPIHEEFASFLNMNRFNLRRKQRLKIEQAKNPLLMMFMYKLVAEEDERMAVSDKKKDEGPSVNIQEAVIVLGDDTQKKLPNKNVEL